VVKTLWGFVALIFAGCVRAGGQSGVPHRFPQHESPGGLRGVKVVYGFPCHDATSATTRKRPWALHGSCQHPAELEKAPKLATSSTKTEPLFRSLSGRLQPYQSEVPARRKWQGDFQTQYRLDYVVGAGFTGYTYLFHRDNWLFEAPLSYYTKTQQWELSPGYATQGKTMVSPANLPPVVWFATTVSPSRSRDATACISAAVPVRRTRNQIAKLSRPRELHVRETGGRDMAKAPAVGNLHRQPGQAFIRLADDICMSCIRWGPGHLAAGQGISGISGLERLFTRRWRCSSSRKGRPTGGSGSPGNSPPVRGSLEIPLWWKISRLEMSKCFQASQGRLSCITCHVDPPPAHTRESGGLLP